MNDTEIKDLWSKFHVPKNIRRHMEKVSEVAVRTGKKLIDRGVPLDLKLLRQAALLHDLAKIITCFEQYNPQGFGDMTKVEDLEAWNRLSENYKGMTDPEITALVLRQIGETKLAEIVRKHHFTAVIEEGNEPTTWEEKVLYYTDKLVMHDKEVTFNKRLKDLDKRYSPDGEVPENIKLAKKQARKLEREIKTKLK